MKLVPAKSLGFIEIGMKRHMVIEKMNEKPLDFSRNNKLIDGFRDGRLQVHYDLNEMVFFIEVSRDYLEIETIQYDGIDIFNLEVEDILRVIKNKLEVEPVELETGTSFIFKEHGLSLWRSRTFDEKFLEEDWFKEMSDENKQYELRYRFFETACIWVLGCYDELIEQFNATK